MNDLRNLDRNAFAADLAALREQLDADLGPDDLDHLQRIELWGRICAAVGYALAWVVPNPVSVLLLSQARFTRWGILAHHVIHRGYDRVPGAPGRYTSKGFAKGWRRFVDWFDWIAPDAWHEEHNIRHHYRLGETADPDVAEINLRWLRESRLPMPLRYVIVGVFMGSWKFVYYAPNTLTALHETRARRMRSTSDATSSSSSAWSPFSPRGRDLWLRCWLPYTLWNLVAVPALFLLVSPWAALSVLINLLLAEVVTNVHSFVMIVPNHAGDDLYRFETPTEDRAEFFLRQVVGSTNYRCGGDFNDFLHGWLNYQIEHHLWPDLTLRQYQRAQPLVRALCEKHGVPYVQESVWVRLRKTVAIMTGRTSMKVWEEAFGRGEESPISAVG